MVPRTGALCPIPSCLEDNLAFTLLPYLPYLILPYLMSYLTLHPTSYLTLLYLTLPYLRSYVILHPTLPYILHYLTLLYQSYLLPYLTNLISYLSVLYFILPYHTLCLTLPYIMSYLRCLAGHMAMHACQIGPTDTAPPCPGSPLRACIGTKGGTLWGRQPFCPHFSSAT